MKIFHRIEFSLFARLSSFYLRRLFQALTLSSTWVGKWHQNAALYSNARWACVLEILLVHFFFFNVTELWKHHPAVLEFRWATWRRRPLHCGTKTDTRSKWTSTSALQRECWNWKLLRWECEKVKCEYPYICVYISVLYNHLWIHLHIWL